MPYIVGGRIRKSAYLANRTETLLDSMICISINPKDAPETKSISDSLITSVVRHTCFESLLQT